MKQGTEVLVQPYAFRDDISKPVVAEIIEPIGGESAISDDEVAIRVKIKRNFQWGPANCFIVKEKYCTLR